MSAVRKLLPTIAFLLLAVLAWTMPAQAGGVSSCVTGGEASCFSHVAGDADEVPADEHEAQPHHHGGCHGHHLGVASGGRDVAPLDQVTLALHAHVDAGLISSGTDPGLRPPQA